MSTYVRPSIVGPVIRDSDGHVVEYGNRWRGSPPENSYTVDRHPERFAPIHAVADALITHLRSTYDVTLHEGEEAMTDLLQPIRDVVRAVRIRPSDPTCATLTFVLTAYPGAVLHAGLLHDFHFPECGCDACDSTWDAEADQLERNVIAVVTGRYRETVGRWVEYAFTYPDGTISGRSRPQDIPTERLRAAKTLLREHPDGWAAWRVAAAATS